MRFADSRLGELGGCIVGLGRVCRVSVMPWMARRLTLRAHPLTAQSSGVRRPQKDDKGESNRLNEPTHLAVSIHPHVHRDARLSRNALPMTDTELSVMAALAQMGLISTPRAGYRTPAATGTPTAL